MVREIIKTGEIIEKSGGGIEPTIEGNQTLKEIRRRFEELTENQPSKFEYEIINTDGTKGLTLSTVLVTPDRTNYSCSLGARKHSNGDPPSARVFMKPSDRRHSIFVLDIRKGEDGADELNERMTLPPFNWAGGDNACVLPEGIFLADNAGFTGLDPKVILDILNDPELELQLPGEKGILPSKDTQEVLPEKKSRFRLPWKKQPSES